MKTRYIVCRRTGSSGLEILGVRETSGPTAASRDFAGQGGTYIAIPVRNWHEEHFESVVPEPKLTATPVEPVFPGQMGFEEIEEEHSVAVDAA
jgi:hypothetical protein